MPVDYTNPRVLNFLIENYTRESENRSKWFLKNEPKLKESAAYGDNYKGYNIEDVLRAPMDLSMSALAQQYKDSYVNRLKASPSDGPIISISALKTSLPLSHTTINLADARDPICQRSAYNLSSDPIMRPVDISEIKILFPETEKGRTAYLKARSQKLPEDRYYFCEVSNQVHGWRLREHKKHKPEYGHHSTFFRCIANRSGSQPDPSHYDPPAAKVFTKCFGSMN